MGSLPAQAPREFNFGKFDQTPKPRMGGLPYPGLFTAFELADPRRLGNHAYDGEWGEPEVIRGIVYTRRGGFIDVAHARKAIDLCKYVQVRAEAALRNDLPAFQLKSLEPSVFVIRLNYPAFWPTLSAGEKELLSHELSIRMAQRIAMMMVTWHEVLTWFGYQSTPIVSERESSFTYDDTGAHAFGVTVGGRALRSNLEWDRAVTEEMGRMLTELEVVSPGEAMAAVERVRGAWWSDAGMLKRQIETGWDGPVTPWLMRGVSSGGREAPYRYELPRLESVGGRNFAGLFRMEIQPNVGETDAMRAVIAGAPAMFDVERDMPSLVAHMRRAEVRQHGEAALRPYREEVRGPFFANERE
jgi:hypothetical protein